MNPEQKVNFYHLCRFSYHSDCFESKKNSAKEQRKVRQRSNCLSITKAQVGPEKYVIGDDPEASQSDHVGERRQRCKHLQVSQVIYQYERQQEYGQVNLEIEVAYIVIHNLLDVYSDENRVDAAATYLVHHQKRVGDVPETISSYNLLQKVVTYTKYGEYCLSGLGPSSTAFSQVPGYVKLGIFRLLHNSYSQFMSILMHHVQKRPMISVPIEPFT